MTSLCSIRCSASRTTLLEPMTTTMTGRHRRDYIRLISSRTRGIGFERNGILNTIPILKKQYSLCLVPVINRRELNHSFRQRRRTNTTTITTTTTTMTKTSRARIPNNLHHSRYLTNSDNSDNTPTKNKHSNKTWQNWFRSDEYLPLWQTPPSPPSSSSSTSSDPMSMSSLYLQPLPNTQLDNLSQMTISLLSDMSRNIRRGTDLATSQRCNHALRLLIDAAETSSSSDSPPAASSLDQTSTSTSHTPPEAQTSWLYTDRAYLLWKTLESTYDAVQSRHLDDYPPSSHSSHRRRRLPYQPPRVERDIYVRLADLYSTPRPSPSPSLQQKEEDTDPDRVHKILTTMSNRYHNERILDLRPNVVLWNKVIVSWANSNHIEKAHRAASVLRNCLTPAGSGVGKSGGGGGGGSGIGGMGIEADLSSYGHVLKACATVDRGNEKARRLGAEIAVMVWRELEGSGLLFGDDDDDDDDGGGGGGRGKSGRRRRRGGKGDDDNRKKERRPNVFVFAIRSMQLVDRETERNSMVRRMFELCKELGLVNNHVLLAFESVASSGLVNEQFCDIGKEERGDGDSRSGGSSSLKRKQTMRTKKEEEKKIRVVRSFWQIPSEWKRNVPSKDSLSGW